MKRRLFFATLILPLSGCEITLHFYVEKAWDVSPGFTAANPDMKTRAEVEVKLGDPPGSKKDDPHSK